MWPWSTWKRHASEEHAGGKDPAEQGDSEAASDDEAGQCRRCRP